MSETESSPKPAIPDWIKQVTKSVDEAKASKTRKEALKEAMGDSTPIDSFERK